MTRFRGPVLPSHATADVTLLLEGTYPYVSGGVSSWVHQIVTGLPDIAFALVFIGGSPDRYGDPRYPLGDNVVHLEEHYLSEVLESPRSRSGLLGDREFFEASAGAHRAFRADSERLGTAMEPVVKALLADTIGRRQDFLFSERAWTEICQRYELSSSSHSFLDYFWTVRSMHAPLFLMAEAVARTPRSRAFHVVSTGFAGFLGMLLRHARRRPLILTEHGIYTKERRIELLQATWIKDDETVSAETDNPGVGIFRQLWIRFFEALGRMTYEAADPIVALYQGNRARQIDDGAEPSRTRVVPNGIALDRFRPLREIRSAVVPEVLGLIGRVVPIKDIKTFVRALRMVCSELPGVQGWIVGPEEEDPSYAEECHNLVSNLGLSERVTFLGFRKVEEVFPRLGINILTSISEAQPLSVLEGFAAGVPCIATDVGCCRELIEGISGEDRALGAAGAVVPIADAEGVARAAIALLSDPDRWFAAQQAGIARVERFYTQQMMLDRYRALYRSAMDS